METVCTATVVPSTTSATVTLPATGSVFVKVTLIVDALPGTCANTDGTEYVTTGALAMTPYHARVAYPAGVTIDARYSTAPVPAEKVIDAWPVAFVVAWYGPLQTLASETGLPETSVTVKEAVAWPPTGTVVFSSDTATKTAV